MLSQLSAPRPSNWAVASSGTSRQNFNEQAALSQLAANSGLLFCAESCGLGPLGRTHEEPPLAVWLRLRQVFRPVQGMPKKDGGFEAVQSLRQQWVKLNEASGIEVAQGHVMRPKVTHVRYLPQVHAVVDRPRFVGSIQQ